MWVVSLVYVELPSEIALQNVFWLVVIIYIGGIAGASEGNTVVSGCYTLVEITHGNRYIGAICGTETGEFTNNYYVSDTLAGLGRIGYTGKAEPISFEALCQVSGMPSSMTQFTLRFLVEDEEIKSYDLFLWRFLWP